MVLTNRSDLFVDQIQVSVSFSEPVDFISATNLATGGTADLIGSSVVYDIPTLDGQESASLTLQIFAVTPGFLTNYFDYTGNGLVPQSEDVRVRIFSADADLGVSLASPTNTIVAGDWITYRLSVTNRGPDTVDSVVVTTGWPPNTEFISMNPSIPNTIVGNEMTFTSPSINPGSQLAYDITIQPNDIGVGELVAKLFVDNLLDRNPGDNVVTNSLSVGAAVAANLTVTIMSGQAFNPQTGLMEQTIRLTNTGTTNVNASRVVIDNFGEQVYNAAGTNNATPYVSLTSPLAPSESVELTLEYFIPSRTAVADPTFSGVSVPDFVPGVPDGSGVLADAIHALDGGRVLIEFSSDAGNTYSVIYSDDVSFTAPARALPAISAAANRVQWIDAGPPKTRELPGASAHRFYRVIEIPK